jgi:hypothetical protein
MPTPRRLDEGQSGICAIKRWLQNWIVLSGSSVRQAIAPPAISCAEQQRFGPFSGGYDLLLMRMEALQLDPGEVRRIETAVFRDLAEACGTCHRKDQCGRDVAYILRGKVNHNWEDYCPNATILNAMRELPWFERKRRPRAD